ncbi:Hok/Gef family protein [Escherichia coli]|nr:Hok/Gef family protein [Escherichia coli]MBB7735353.1 Hok/Gef family protein [Escherichia coli]
MQQAQIVLAQVISLVTTLVMRKDLREVRIRTGQT